MAYMWAVPWLNSPALLLVDGNDFEVRANSLSAAVYIDPGEYEIYFRYSAGVMVCLFSSGAGVHHPRSRISVGTAF